MIEDMTPALAFPSQPLGQDGLPEHSAVMGMTLRDWFAGQALGGLIVGSTQADGSPTGLSHEVVKKAYSYADAMLTERAQ